MGLLCQKIFGPGCPWAGLAHLQEWAQIYVVKLQVGSDSPLRPRGPKLGVTFIYPQTPSGYHPKTFGFGPPLGLGSLKTKFLGHFQGPF